MKINEYITECGQKGGKYPIYSTIDASIYGYAHHYRNKDMNTIYGPIEENTDRPTELLSAKNYMNQ